MGIWFDTKTLGYNAALTLKKIKICKKAEITSSFVPGWIRSNHFYKTEGMNLEKKR